MATCPNCGQPNPDGFRYCGACGAQISAQSRSEERKVITVLFADLVGFTSRSERMDVEDVRGTLAPYHALLRNELEHYGGTVEKFIGDAVMAVFGAPVTHEDDPERAVRAALAIRAAIERLNDEVPRLDLHMRVGVNTGEALVVLGADPARGEGMASGDVVNTAARLQAAAPVDGILVGETTYRATDRAITYGGLAEVDAKGKAQPVPAWQALEARARFGVDVVQRPTTPLVGRSEEVDLLLDALRRCRSESAVQLVTLVGMPGIGKSRLVWELFQAAERDPDFITWRQGRSLPYGEGVTYWALGEMVKAQAGILDSDSAHDAEDKLRRAVADLIPDHGEAAWIEEHVRALAGVGADPAVEGDRLSEAASAWRRFLEALADKAPLVLVFEDLHWADDALLDFIDHLADWASGVPMLVVCTARPELLDRRRGWGGGKRNALTVALSPLADQDIARLIAALLEQAVLPADTQATLLSSASGNPLYAEEYVRMLIDRGHLRHDGDRWRLADTADLPVPESVQGLIAARLDDLPPEEKRLMQDAAVLGKVVWAGALAAMSDSDRYAVEDRLHGLERREMLRRERRSSVGGDTEYAFRHVLVRDIAYGQIPRAVRAEKHRRAAEWIESLSADRENAPEMLAHHYMSALEYARDSGQPTDDLERRTRIALRDAADRAGALNSLAVAHHQYMAAFELWPEEDPEWAELVVAAANSKIGHPDDPLIRALPRARDRLIAAGRLDLAAFAELLMSFVVWNEGRGEEAALHEAAARDIVAEAEPSHMLAITLTRLAIRSMLRDQFDETIELGNRAVEIADQLGLDDIRPHALITTGTARVGRGDLSGLADLELGIEIAERLNAAVSMVRGYKNLASVLADLGELSRSADLEQRGLEAATRFGDQYNIRWFEAELGIHAYLAGSWDHAGELFDRFIGTVDAGAPHYMAAWIRQVRAKMRVARGDLAGAEADLAISRPFARSSGEAQVLLPLLADSALIAALVDGPGAVDEVEALLAELVESAGSHAGGYWTCIMAFALALVERPDAVSRVIVPSPSRWLAVAEMVSQGQYAEAANALAAMGARPEEAIARLLSARALIASGRRPEGEADLRHALEFWRRVGATHHIGLADAMLARTA
jgi:class 3 adenylate cyclase/tetratricopeptide (TPR) repeat protein